MVDLFGVHEDPLQSGRPGVGLAYPGEGSTAVHGPFGRPSDLSTQAGVAAGPRSWLGPNGDCPDRRLSGGGKPSGLRTISLLDQ